MLVTATQIFFTHFSSFYLSLSLSLSTVNSQVADFGHPKFNTVLKIFYFSHAHNSFNKLID